MGSTFFKINVNAFFEYDNGIDCVYILSPYDACIMNMWLK